MKQLDSNELLDKFKKYSSDIKYSDVDDLTIKLSQFLNFLFNQDISNRILERIEEDFNDLKNNLSVNLNQRHGRFYVNIIESLETRELQGALGYFYIKEYFLIKRQHRTHYLDSIRKWYRVADYNDHKQKFNTYFFEPFVELFEWYMYESEAKNNNDYFSAETQDKIFDKLDEMKELLTKLGFGQEIVFDEIRDAKKLTKKLNKKNWTEIITGKLVDLGLSEVISLEMAKKATEFLSGEGIKLLQ